jgi:deoxycytidylate deaminase
MRYLYGEEKNKALEYIVKASHLAKNSTCLRAKGGADIVKDNKIIGEGFNSPPGNLESQRRCNCSKDSYNKKITDKTCCIHAEKRAIFDALRRNPEKLKGSTLYFTRINEKGNLIYSGKPYCTGCSKDALDVGISEFVLFHEEGICVYDIEEYNNLSFQFKE